MVVRAALVTIVALAAHAHAEGPVVGGRSARSIGRAGVGTISDDGGNALLVNPAAIARRESARLQLGVSFIDDEMYWLQSNNSPEARDQSSSRLLPLLAFEGGFHGWVLGAAVTTSAYSERVYRRPDTLLPTDLGNAFEYRYTGLAGSFRRDSLAVGAARLLGENVALGVAFVASRVTVTESRRLWGGLVGRGLEPEQVGDPAFDVELAFSAEDNFQPGATAGVLVAPEDSRIELAASVGWTAPSRAHGEVRGIPIGTEPNTRPNVNAYIPNPAARIVVEEPIAVRTGARYLGEWWAAEVGGDLWIFPRRAEAAMWRMTDVHLIDSTTLGSSRTVQLAEVPSRLSSRTHGALRAAFDVELIGGFLWATTGYAFTTGGTAHARLAPTFGDLGGHTLALGLETTAGGFTITLGWARTWSVKEREPVTRWELDNPFGTGDTTVPTGTYDGSTDMIGLSVDVDFQPD